MAGCVSMFTMSFELKKYKSFIYCYSPSVHTCLCCAEELNTTVDVAVIGSVTISFSHLSSGSAYEFPTLPLLYERAARKPPVKVHVRHEKTTCKYFLNMSNYLRVRVRLSQRITCYYTGNDTSINLFQRLHCE